MTQYQQRGNVTECVQWTGYNLEEVKAFILDRYQGEAHVIEFLPTVFNHLVIVVNFAPDDAVAPYGGMVLQRGMWLVDQGPILHPFGVVFCEPERFEHLYKEVDHGN